MGALPGFRLRPLAAAVDHVARQGDVPGLAVAVVQDGDAAAAAAVDVVAGQVDVIALGQLHARFLVPFDAVAGESQRGRCPAPAEARALVAREPVVENEAVPAPHK